MAASRTTKSREINEIFSNPESENESDSELEIDMEQMKIDNDSESDMEVSDDKNSLSSCSSSQSARSWQKANFRPKLFQFQSNNCGKTGNLNEDSPLDFFKLFFDQNLIQIIVNETNKFQANTTDEYASPSSHQAQWYPTAQIEQYGT
jgi:hypothetical protein